MVVYNLLPGNRSDTLRFLLAITGFKLNDLQTGEY